MAKNDGLKKEESSHFENKASLMHIFTRILGKPLLMAVQSFSQLEERYGKNEAETIKSNAVTHLLLLGAGLQETRYYSERIGDTTIRTESMTKRGSGFAGEVSGSESEVRRRLMTADELRTMRPDQMLMIEAITAPCCSRQHPTFAIRN